MVSSGEISFCQCRFHLSSIHIENTGANKDPILAEQSRGGCRQSADNIRVNISQHQLITSWLKVLPQLFIAENIAAVKMKLLLADLVQLAMPLGHLSAGRIDIHSLRLPRA